MKKYNINGTTYSFEIISKETTRVGIIYFARCIENGREAWLDESGVQFCDESTRFPAYEVNDSYSHDNSVAMWGGLPVARYNYQKTSINSRY